MSQQAKYITNLERALEGLLECFYQHGNEPITISAYIDERDAEALLSIDCKVTSEALDAIAYANEILYGDDALMEDEI